MSHVTGWTLNFPLVGPLVENFADWNKCQCVVRFSCTYSFQDLWSPWQTGSCRSSVLWSGPGRDEEGGVRVDVSSPRRWANNELSFYSRAERSRRELHLPAAPRAISHVKQGSWRPCSFIWCLNGLRTPAVGPVTGHYWVSVIIRLLLVKGAPMKRAGSGREWLGYCWNGSQSWGQLPPNCTGIHRPVLNNLITQKFIIFLDMMFGVHSF